MEKFVLKEVVSDSCLDELHKIGFDEDYRFVMQDKFRYKNIKIFGLSLAQANILKQLALSVGADCGTHHDVIIGKIESSDVILCGSVSQYKKIVKKLKTQPFKLSLLGDQILEILGKRARKTKLVGILNVTPDSFSDGGEYFESNDAINHLLQLIEDGADIIDIGAESTRPYSEPVTDSEQIERLKPVLNFVQKENIKIPISIDTRSSVVADYVLNNGASIINDVSGFDFDKKMPEVIAKYSAGVVIQHSKGTPKDMQKNIEYENLIDEIFFSLKSKIVIAEENGLKNIIIDPGIGFGKTKEHNLEILDRIEEFYTLNYPLMVGISRKSFLVKQGDNDLKDSLSLALSYPLIQKGVDYLRVHNVKLHKRILELG